MKEWKPAHLEIYEGEQVYVRPKFDDFMSWLAEHEK